MRNLLALLGAALVTFAIVGWYRGWYQVSTEPEPGGHREVKIDINGPKMATDVHQGTRKLESVLENKGKGQPVQGPALPPQTVQVPAGTNAVPGGARFAPPAGFAPSGGQFAPPAGFEPPAYPNPQGETYVLPPNTAVSQPRSPGNQ